MKQTFKFLTLSRVFNDCRDTVGRLSTLFLLLFALLGISPNVWAWTRTTFSGRTLYFNQNQIRNEKGDEIIWMGDNAYAWVCVRKENQTVTHGTRARVQVSGDIYKVQIPDGEWDIIQLVRGPQSGDAWNYSYNIDAGWFENSNYLSDDGTNYRAYIYTPGAILYFDNSTTNWANVYAYIGRDNHVMGGQMTKVSGTNNLYNYTFSSYTNYHKIVIKDGTIETGDNKSIYQSTTQSTEHMTYRLEDNSCFTPTESYSGGDSKTYFKVNTSLGLPKQNVTITTPTNGSIKVTYTDENGTTQTKTSGNFSVAQTCILTVTATGNDGYHLSSLSVGGSTFTSGNTYIVRAATTISATFAGNVYDITYKDQGGADFTGENEDELPATHTYGTATTLVNATRAGYRFDGWFENSDCTGSAITEIGTTAKTADFTLYAKWTEDKVYYDVTSGVKSFAGTTEQQTSKADLSISATFGEYNSSTNKVLASSILKFTVSNIATGYAIEGWYSNAACSVKIAGAGTSNTYTTPAVDGDVSVYVKILATQYNITYNDVYGTNPNPSSYNVEDEITFEALTGTRTGYTFTGWNPTGIAKGSTGDKSTSAQWQAKTYTISFSQEGGTGGQTGTVTATYDQPMPALTNPFTAPTRVGYKFKGYYDATSGGTQYYTAAGASAHTWNKDANTTLYAQWTQLYCFIEGRFSIATSKARSSWTSVASSFGGWDTVSTRIPMEWDETNKCYKLVTWATLKDLTDKQNNDYQFFNIKQSTSSNSLTDVVEYMQSEEGNLTLADKGVKKNWVKYTSGKVRRPHFDAEDKTGYVIIYFNETQLWYELDEFPTYDVEFSNGGGGGTVTPSGTKKTGEVSWTVTANPYDDYSFAGWTLTGGAHAQETDEQLKTYYTIHVTATGDGKAIANFKKNPKVYFQTCDGWGNDVYVYFYKGSYWDNEKGSGSAQSNTNWIAGPYHMHYTGGNNIHEFAYDVEMLREKGMSNYICFTNTEQSNYNNFGNTENDKTHVAYTDGFYPCDQPLYVAEGWEKDLNEKKAAYYKGHWSNMLGDDAEDYLMMQSENWKPNENMRFKKDNNGNWTVIKTYAGTGDAYKDLFKVWRNCDGNWYGYGQSKDGEMSITSDTRNAKIYAGNHNVEIIPWKAGEYEFTWNPNAKEISVIYLGDITVANFPGEVSTFVNRQHKIKPDVTLRNGTKVTDVTITVNGHTLPWSSSYATYEQNGTNLVITGNAIGTDDNLTVRYQNNKQDPYIVDRTLKVNVAEPIVIQAKLTEGDTYWSKTGLVHIHFWGDHAETAQDLTMSYNSETKLFSVTAPMITNPFKFIFWYGEDISMSDSENWRKTQDITDCTTSTCYTISNGTNKTETRTATPESGLCTTDEYYVEITMKNGNTYKSNTISGLSKEVSFFAPKDGVTDYTGGTVRIVHNGEVSNPITGFDSAYVYVATINDAATGFASLSAYKGNYYIRTDGAHGAWGDYKTDADNLMMSFTPRAEKGETFSYYWVKNVAKTGSGTDGKVNVKADVANDYNDNLAGMIENDKFTDGGGYVYESTNGANVRFSYEPTTNEFKRAILGGSGNNNFLNVYSKTNNLYADNGHTKQLSESADLNDSKFSDLSDWVYEKQVYVTADGSHAVNVILKSVFNGQTTHLLGYTKNEKGEDTDVPNELEVMGSQSTGDFALRITYDFKKNRLIASWEPGQREISENMIIDSDVLFVQQEAADGTIDNTDVAQITYSPAGIEADAKLTSLKNMIYVLEVTDKVIEGTSPDNQLYWICLPFDCRISDIYGVEGYVTLDAEGRATDGLWGIQRYDGTTRAQHGWFKEDHPEGFWRWMKRDETMKAGTGYVVVFDKTNASSWPNINVEVACEEESDECKDGKKTVEKRSKRLYFPSIGSKFTISYSGDAANVVHYADEPCNVTSPVDRTQYDGNWKVIGPVSYNNIGVDENATGNLTFYYTYAQSNTQGSRYIKHENLTGSELLKSFHGYMTQFGGDLTWKPFTKSDDVTPTAQAPHYMENPDFQGGLLTIELNNAQSEQLDRTFINLSKNGTTGFDQNLDLTMIVENGSQIASVSEDVLYAGNTLPLDIELVPLNVKVVANGTYDIALEQSLEGLEVRLYDAFEQTTTPLDLMSATVTLDKGEYKDRFFLQFVQKSPLSPTSFDGKLEQYNLPTDKTQKLLINDQIYLINGGRVYNVLGVEE